MSVSDAPSCGNSLPAMTTDVAAVLSLPVLSTDDTKNLPARAGKETDVAGLAILSTFTKVEASPKLAEEFDE